MQPIVLSALLAATCLLAGLIGLALRPRLRDHHLDDDSRGIVSNITGLIAAMTALLLGLLVAQAQSSYQTVSDEVDQIAANIVELDRMLAHYGPETAAARVLLKDLWTLDVESIWPTDDKPANLGALSPIASNPKRDQLLRALRGLQPQDATQRNMLGDISTLMAQNARLRVMLTNQIQSDLPAPILLVVCFWLVMLFLAFGLLARRNAVVLGALAVGAISIGGGLFLLLELNRPFGGLMAIDGGSLRNALGMMGG